MCEECCTPLQGRNKDRLLNAYHPKNPAFGGVFLLLNKNRTKKTVPESRDRYRASSRLKGSLERDLPANFFDFLLESFGFVLGDAFFDGLGSSLHKCFGIAETLSLIHI